MKFSLINMLLYIFILILFATIIYSIDKGFDFKDEGLSISLISDGNKINHSLYNYNIFFPDKNNLSIKEIRIIKLTSLSVMIFSLLLFRNKFDESPEFLFLIIGLFCMYSLFGHLISYNNIVFIFLFFYLIFLNEFINSNKKYFYAFILGLVTSLIFFPKLTSSLALFCWTCVIILFSHTKKNTYKIFSIMYFFIGYILVQIVINSSAGENIFLNTIQTGMEYSGYANNYNRFTIIFSMASSLRWIMFILLSGFFIGRALYNSDNIKKFLFYSSVSVLILMYFYLAHYTLNLFRLFEYSLVIVSIFLIGLIISYVSLDKISKKEFWLSLTLFVFPLVGYVGTNVYFFKFAQLFLFYYFFLIVYLLSMTEIKKFFKNIIFIILSFLLLVRVVSNIIIFPFNQPSLLGAFEKYEYGVSKKIFLDRNQVKYLYDLKCALNKYVEPNGYLIGLYAMSGDIFLSGYKNYYNPCIWNRSQWDYLASKMRIEGIVNLPHVLTNDIESVLEKYPHAEKLDSVIHFSGSSVYLIDINTIK